MTTLKILLKSLAVGLLLTIAIIAAGHGVSYLLG
jgi:hypothetical protein